MQDEKLRIPERDDASRNTMKIAVTSNVRLGIHQYDPIRGSDAFEAFEDVLNLCVIHKVDMLVIAGDLFEDSSPNFRTFLRCIRLLKKYVFGDKRIAFHLTDNYNVATCSDTSSKDIVQAAIPELNYANRHLNIALPIFVIFGDRDRDAEGRRGSAIRALHALGLINVFGDFKLEDRLNISPLFFHKGETQLALFGLGHLPAYVLDYAMVHINMSFHIVNRQTSYKMFVIHQEAAELRDHIVPAFMDMAVFGAETAHVDGQNVLKGDTMAIQPGSPVVARYSDGEAVPKALQILTLRNKTCDVLDLPLEGRLLFYRQITIQPFAQRDGQYVPVQAFVENRLRDELEELLSIARHSNSDRTPLIRVDAYLQHVVQEVNLDRLNTWYYSRVANPYDIVSQTVDRVKELGEEDNYGQVDSAELAVAIATITQADY